MGGKQIGGCRSHGALSHSPQIVRTSLGTQGCLRVSCSLGGFGFLAFAFLVFLLKSIHMSSEEVRVRLKMKEVQMVDLSKRQNFKKNMTVSVLYGDQKRF